MQQSVTIGGRQFIIRIDTGTVLDITKYTDARIQSKGYGNTVHIDTITCVNMDVWLQDDAGREIPLQLFDTDVPLRAGHRVTIVSLTRKDGKYARGLVIHNDATGLTNVLVKPAQAVAKLQPPAFRKAWIVGLAGAALALPVGVGLGAAWGCALALAAALAAALMGRQAAARVAAEYGEALAASMREAGLAAQAGA